ncbi:hypothetical protein [Gottfriedia luciferensis]|uniref:hypothetical protein n=1 Tax=Gottfriedia luciferensis TaxID=178774 RepID=UPI000B444C58|nr:hypothetical protein [Gottfriedia luciferensis]
MRLDMFITFILFSVYTSLLSKIVAGFFHFLNILMYGVSGMVSGALIFLIITKILRVSGKIINLKLAIVIIMINSGLFGVIGKYFDLN